MNAAQQAAAEIFRRCEASPTGKPFAVVLTNDKRGFQMCGPRTDIAEKALASRPDCFVGVYDMDALPADIASDLMHAGLLS